MLCYLWVYIYSIFRPALTYTGNLANILSDYELSLKLRMALATHVKKPHWSSCCKMPRLICCVQTMTTHAPLALWTQNLQVSGCLPSLPVPLSEYLLDRNGPSQWLPFIDVWIQTSLNTEYLISYLISLNSFGCIFFPDSLYWECAKIEFIQSAEYLAWTNEGPRLKETGGLSSVSSYFHFS